MGVDIQKKAQKSFQKRIDTALKEISSGQLFNSEPEECPRRFLADPAVGSSPSEGDQIDLEIQGNTLIGVRGTELVLRTENPPADIVAHVRAQGGVAEGKIVAVNDLSGMLEIDLC